MLHIGKDVKQLVGIQNDATILEKLKFFIK